MREEVKFHKNSTYSGGGCGRGVAVRAVGGRVGRLPRRGPGKLGERIHKRVLGEEDALTGPTTVDRGGDEDWGVDRHPELSAQDV